MGNAARNTKNYTVDAGKRMGYCNRERGRKGYAERKAELQTVRTIPLYGRNQNTLTEVKERLSAVERLASDTAKRLDALESKERERR